MCDRVDVDLQNLCDRVGVDLMALVLLLFGVFSLKQAGRFGGFEDPIYKYTYMKI